MKFRLLYIGVIAVASACLTSCSDWFDVSPKTDVKAEELFETPEGFESALAGIYISLTDEDSYGHDMSWPYRPVGSTLRPHSRRNYRS